MDYNDRAIKDKEKKKKSGEIQEDKRIDQKEQEERKGEFHSKCY